MLNLFKDIPVVYPLYFFYGAAFIFLGIAVFVKDTKRSDLKLADNLRLLGLFGFTHGAHEWLELIPLLQGEHLTLRDIFYLKAFTVVLVILSFFFLLTFGLSMLQAVDLRWGRWRVKILAALGILWAAHLVWRGLRFEMQFLSMAETTGRLVFGMTGGLAAAVGLIRYSREVRYLSRTVSKKIYFGGVAFLFYALFAGAFTSHSSLPIVSIPVEAARGVSTVFITYFVIVALNIFDIETRRKIEHQIRVIAQGEKLSSLGRLAAGIAHEINNPLTNASLGIQTARQRLNDIGVAGEIVEKLESVERNIDRASAIARELLQFSRQKETESAPVNINAVITGALMLLHYKLKECVIRRSLTPVADVEGDPVKLEQVFVNILANAAEAMPGGGELWISTSQKDGGIVVTVNDTGTGISREHLTRVFDPFYTTKEVGVGTGLGLSICYGIIKQHKGTIEISSAEGKGTTVTVKIPTRKQNEKNPYR